MPRIRLSAVALDDLEQIEAYIAVDNPWAAKDIRRRIIESIETLATMPRLGRPGRVLGTRELVVTRTPFIVPYWQPRPGEIEILAVIHGARRWPDILPNP
jgi:plasmid stabilization system protein ParE